MVAIRETISAQYSSNLTKLAAQRPTEWTLLPDFSFTLEDVEACAGFTAEKIAAIVNAFTTFECDPELKLVNSSNYNKSASHPLIQLKDGTRLAFLDYGLFECLYDGPFYWIGLDKEYLGKHSQTTGSFVEAFAERTLTKVFAMTMF